jgi:hypothetical protein
MQRVRETTPTDILLTGLFVGVAAGLSGAGNWIDKTLMGYTMGFKSSMTHKQVLARGALVGAIISLPFAYISASTVADAANLGTAANANVPNVFVNPGRFDNPPAAPKDYVYAQDPVGGGQYLIIDPKYNL